MQPMLQALTTTGTFIQKNWLTNQNGKSGNSKEKELDMRFELINEESFFSIIQFLDPRMERTYIEQVKSENVTSSLWLMLFWCLIVLFSHLAVPLAQAHIFESDPKNSCHFFAATQEDGDAEKNVGIMHAVLALLICIALCRPGKRLEACFPVFLVALYSVQVVHRIIKSWEKDCDDAASLTGDHNESTFGPDALVCVKHRADCSLNGSMALQMWVAFMFTSPQFMPFLGIMHAFTWSWVLVIFVLLWYYNPSPNERFPGYAVPSATYFDNLEIIVNGVLLAIAATLAVTRKSYMMKSQRKKFIDDCKEKEASERMFHILEYMVPEHVIVPMLQNPNGVISEHKDKVSILFIMIVDFETKAHNMTPENLLSFLNRNFTEWDGICKKHQVTKIETVGEEYVAAVGVVPEDERLNKEQGHGILSGRLAAVGLEILELQEDDVQFKMGMHTGPIVAGVIGQKLPRFRLFGSTINTAARMMQKCEHGKLQIGVDTKRELPPEMKVTECRMVEMKGMGMVETFYLDPNKNRESMQHSQEATMKRPSLVKRRSLVDELHVGGAADETPDGSGETGRGSAGLEGSAVSSPFQQSAAKRKTETAQPLLHATEIELSAVKSNATRANTDGMDEGGTSPMLARLSRKPVGTNTSSWLGASTVEEVDDGEGEGASESKRRFEEVLKATKGDNSADSGGFLGNRAGARVETWTPEEEAEWLLWFHKTVVCKKFGKRIETQMLFLSFISAALGFWIVWFEPSSGEWVGSMPWNTTTGAFFSFSSSTDRVLVFLVAQVIPFAVLTGWRTAASSEWMQNAPKDVQFRLMVSLCIICFCLFISFDTLIVPVEPEFYDMRSLGVHSEKTCDATSTTMECIQMTLLDEMINSKNYQGPLWSQVFVLMYVMMLQSHQLRLRETCVFVALSLVIMGFQFLTLTTYFSITGMTLFVCNSMIIAFQSHNAEVSSRKRFKAKTGLQKTSQSIEGILNTLMPPLVIEELQQRGQDGPPPSHAYERATIAQSDLCGFTKMASTRTPQEVVQFIGEIFGKFDDANDRHRVYKVETVGDAYIAGQAGWPLTQQNSPISVILFAIEMVRAVHEWAREKELTVSCRVGIHTGRCIGGIVGTEMQRYHLFGKLLAELEGLESTSVEGRVQASDATRKAVKQQMSTEGINPSAIVFEQRKEPHLSTSKGDVVRYEDVGGPTYLVRRTTKGQCYEELLPGGSM